MKVYRIYFKDKGQKTELCKVLENLNEALEMLKEILGKFDEVKFVKEEEED